MSKKIKKEQSQVNRKLELKKETADYIDIMIQQAEKGPSGFWRDVEIRKFSQNLMKD